MKQQALGIQMNTGEKTSGMVGIREKVKQVGGGQTDL